ncbi:MAG: universal stress protein [Cyanobacteria bacterium]|nr:universal stress protein [Cyanobacteriota bacterium]
MKIMVAVDGSECSRDAVDFVAERAWKNDDEFMIVTVVEPIPTEYGLGLVLDGNEFTQEHRDASELVANLGLILREELPANNSDAKVLSGLVVEQICQWARVWGADLIVMGSHGRKGFQHFMLGSVAEEVLRTAPCTVEVVKHRKHFKDSKQLESDKQLAASSKEKGNE